MSTRHRKTSSSRTQDRNARAPAQSRRRRRRREPVWVDWPDDQLLNLRLKNLKLRIEGTELEQYVEKLYEELEQRGISFRPHVWLSNEFFSPDGIPGIAIPFYLAHPRLKQLERKQMLEVEGGTQEWCMRILRHEAGHTLDTAYRLHRRRRWREMFGQYSQPYPKFYQPKPYSKSYVLHLDMWYAQAHPAEDFAETFAVWLRPRSRWRQQYAGWGALRKLEYVDELMREVAGEKPAVYSRAQVDPLRGLNITLRDHYRQKREYYADEWPDFYDRDLRRLFSDGPEHRRRPTAASFLRRIRPELRELVSKWTGEYQYTIDQVLQDMIDRCAELKLRMALPPSQAKVSAIVMVTVQTMNYLHSGHHRVAL
jgi:hypothetical protein